MKVGRERHDESREEDKEKTGRMGNKREASLKKMGQSIERKKI